ncbi:DoxX family protein [Virgibacillus senegalensis]|uniref:DoxX family protein n=1 Tax=Virgibacillus senegalensis TaxID=1499679 RepID=UPI00069DB361|nr:DoxX family protein [Virgibacillus senegalensis]
MRLSISSLQLIRYGVAYVFIVSGILKLLEPSFQKVFANTGLPAPGTFVLLVALTEVIAGGFILFQLYVKRAVIPLLIIMIGALLLTKIPVLHTGFFPFLFEARLDIVMILMLAVLWQNYTK